jgi:hypothetical protein
MEARPPKSRGRQLIDACVEAKGLRMGEYAYFFGTGEGAFLPTSVPGDEVEESSGYVLDRGGNVYFFWFGWDEAAGAPALVEWERQEPEDWWIEVDEYRRALEHVGLVPA